MGYKDIAHYLETFKTKPGALPNSVALIGSGYLKEIYTAYFKDCPRDFIELLSYLKKHRISGEVLEQTLFRLQKTSCSITIEKLKALLGNTGQQYVNITSAENQTANLAKKHLAQISHLMN